MSVLGQWNRRHPSFLFIHRTAIPRSWVGSTEEWVEWPDPMTKEQMAVEVLLDIDPANPQTTVEKMESWLSCHEPNLPASADDLLMAKQSPADAAVDDEIKRIAGTATLVEDVELSLKPTLGHDDGTEAEPNAVTEYLHFTQHQEDQSKDFLMQCRRR